MKFKLIFLTLLAGFLMQAKAQFISQVSETGSNITFSAIQLMGSDFIVAGSENNYILLCEIDNGGHVISSRQITVVDTTVLPYVSSIIVDSDGKIVIAGYRVTDDVYQYTSFILKYDFSAGTADWVKLFENPGSAFFKVIEKKADGPYIVCGQSINAPNGEEGILYSVNRNTGNFTLLNNYNYNNSSESYFSIVKAAGGYYTSNRYNYDGGGATRMRGTLSKFSLTGSEVFSKAYLRNITTNSARLYAPDLCFANSSFYMEIHGDETGSLLNDDLFIVRAKTDGELNWAKLYDFTDYGDDGSFSSIKSKGTTIYALGALNDGLPDYTGNQFLMKLDSAGNVLWANSYNIQSNFRAGRSDALLISGSNIITVGYVIDPFTLMSNGVMMVVKASSGALPGGCSKTEAVTVVSKSTTSYLSALTAVTHTYAISDPALASENSGEADEEVCMNGARLEDVQAEHVIQPNPTTGLFELELSGEENIVEINNYNGQLVYSQNSNEPLLQLDITGSPAGIYYVKVRDMQSGETSVYTLVKE